MLKSQLSLVCPGSARINQATQRDTFLKSQGLTISDWLHSNSYDRRKRQQDKIQRVLDSERQQRTPQLTAKARKAAPQYLDHYIKHKLSLEPVPERPSSGPGALKPQKGKANLDKYTTNEK